MPAPISSREINGYLIESGVPIPPKSRGKARTGLGGAIQNMKVGDCILVSDPKKRANACTYAERIGYKVVSRVVDEGVKLWRTE